MPIRIRRGHPNENLARETMELFTLGVGNYSEEDVREAARSDRLDRQSAISFEFAEKRHDAGEKIVLDHRGPLTGDDFLDILLEHPATAQRLAWRICQTFLGEGWSTSRPWPSWPRGFAPTGSTSAGPSRRCCDRSCSSRRKTFARALPDRSNWSWAP